MKWRWNAVFLKIFFRLKFRFLSDKTVKFRFPPYPVLPRYIQNSLASILPQARNLRKWIPPSPPLPKKKYFLEGRENSFSEKFCEVHRKIPCTWKNTTHWHIFITWKLWNLQFLANIWSRWKCTRNQTDI